MAHQVQFQQQGRAAVAAARVVESTLQPGGQPGLHQRLELTVSQDCCDIHSRLTCRVVMPTQVASQWGHQHFFMHAGAMGVELLNLFGVEATSVSYEGRQASPLVQ
jgi:hypothetical protein